MYHFNNHDVRTATDVLSQLTKINPGRQVRGKRGNNNNNKVLESKSNFKSPSANRQTFTEGEAFLKGLRFHDTALCCFCYQRKQWQPSGGKLELPKGCDRSGRKGWVRGSLNSFHAPQAFDTGEHAEGSQLEWGEKKDVGYRIRETAKGRRGSHTTEGATNATFTIMWPFNKILCESSFIWKSSDASSNKPWGVGNWLESGRLLENLHCLNNAKEAEMTKTGLLPAYCALIYRFILCSGESDGACVSSVSVGSIRVQFFS